MEAPLLSLNPLVKPLKEMTDEELQAWHQRHRAAIFSHQTLVAESRESKKVKENRNIKIEYE